MKSESGFSFAIASQPFVKQYLQQQSLLIGYLILKLFVLMREFLNFAFQNLGQSIINI